MSNLNLGHHVLSASDQRKADLRLAVTYLMEEIGGNETECNKVVAGGQQAWRIELTMKFRQLGLMVNDQVCDGLFEFFCHKVRQRYRAEQSALSAQKIAGTALDHTEESTPPTDLEIVDSLEIDSGGTSDDARREIYGRDGAAERVFEQLKDDLRTNLKRGLPAPWKPDATKNVN